MTANRPLTTAETAAWLRLAQDVTTQLGDPADPLVQAAQHLVVCAGDVMSMPPRHDLDIAREALSCARGPAAGPSRPAIRRETPTFDR